MVCATTNCLNKAYNFSNYFRFSFLIKLIIPILKAPTKTFISNHVVRVRDLIDIFLIQRVVFNTPYVHNFIKIYKFDS